MKKIFLIVLGSMTAITARTQTVLLSKDVPSEIGEKDFGPNEKKFALGYISFGSVTQPGEEGVKIKTGFVSNDLRWGVRMKYKIGSVYSLGWDLNYHATSFSLDQDSGKILPDTILHKNESFHFYAAGLAFYNRFNFDPNRGDYLGKFLDIGIQGDWDFSISTVSNDKLANGNRLKVITRHLEYVQPFNYFVFARIGISHAAIFVNYRLSDQFKKTGLFNFPELPRAIAGIELGIF